MVLEGKIFKFGHDIWFYIFSWKKYRTEVNLKVSVIFYINLINKLIYYLLYNINKVNNFVEENQK